jgi:hypothetical protein
MVEDDRRRCGNIQRVDVTAQRNRKPTRGLFDCVSGKPSTFIPDGNDKTLWNRAKARHFDPFPAPGYGSEDDDTALSQPRGVLGDKDGQRQDGAC